MSEGLGEECGIAAVYQLDQTTAAPINVTQYIPNILLDLQNRGQLSAGVTSYSLRRERLLQTHKDIGDVNQVFRMYHQGKYAEILERYSGVSAIGHVRYATSGREDSNFAQPFERVHGRKWKWFSIAFNGNLSNFEELKTELIEKGYHITYNTDTEVMMHYINKELIGEGKRKYADVFASLCEILDGAFNIAFINADGELVVMRDPNGIKPICYGVKNNLLFVSSESVALTRLGISDYKDIAPGEMLIATPAGGLTVEQFIQPQRKAHCQFEWVYFANLASNLDGKSVYQVRTALGVELAKQETLDSSEVDLVVPVPETAKVATNAFGFAIGLPVVEGLIRNRYVGRTFIEGETRQSVIRRKFTPLADILANQRIFLVDDSLVRAMTLKTIVSDLRNRGKVKEIHIRIASPPIIAPCFYGINIPTTDELFATQFQQSGEWFEPSEEMLVEMAKELGADSLRYLTVDNLCNAIGFGKEELCTACITREYPTRDGAMKFQQLRLPSSPLPFSSNPNHQ